MSGSFSIGNIGIISAPTTAMKMEITDDRIDGDVLLEPGIDLARLACETAEAARRSAASLDSGAGSETLLTLVDYVARRAS